MATNSYPPPPYSENLAYLSSTTDLYKPRPSCEGKEILRVKNAERNGKLNTSDIGTLIHLVKGSLGTGLLAVPYAFRNIGMLAGVIGIALIAFITAHCTHILVKCSQELCYVLDKSSLTYTETVESAFIHGSGGRFRKYSRFMRYLSIFFMFITYYGVNTIYIILIAESVQTVLENHVDFTMSIRIYALIMYVVVFPIGIVRHIKFLVPFSTIANFCTLIGCGLTVYICCIDLPSLSTRPLVVSVNKWSLFFSTALFGMEGIGTVMPVENVMRYPAHFLGCPGVLNFAMTIIATANLVVGSIGYLKYGDAVEGSITLNLPEDTLSESVKIMIAVAILFTYPLQLTASVEVVWENVRHKFSEKKQTSGYYLVRAIMITGTVVIAAAVPDLSPVIALIGAIGFSGLGLFLPTITELVVYWDTLSKPCGLTIIKAVVLLIIWAFATIAGSISSIQEIIEDY